MNPSLQYVLTGILWNKGKINARRLRWVFLFALWLVAGAGCTRDAELFECDNCVCQAGAWEQVESFPWLPNGRPVATRSRNGLSLLVPMSASATAELGSWRWDGSAWTDSTVGTTAMGTAPTYRSAFAATYDSVRDVSLVFGGRFTLFGGLATPQTWVRNAEDTWSLAIEGVTAGPAQRVLSELVFDVGGERSILFGGLGDGGRLATGTWAFADGVWTELDTPSPPPRVQHAMATDEATGDVVLFGGRENDSAPTGDTWLFSAGTWQRQDINPSPPARRAHSLVYHPGLRRVILSGGISASGEGLNDVWAWDGEQWTEIWVDAASARPTSHAFSVAGYDTVNDAVLTMGSSGGALVLDSSETWLLRIRSTGAEMGACCGDGVCQYQEARADNCAADCDAQDSGVPTNSPAAIRR